MDLKEGCQVAGWGTGGRHWRSRTGGGTGQWVAKLRQENINANLSRKVVREEPSGLGEFSGLEIKEKQRC